MIGGYRVIYGRADLDKAANAAVEAAGGELSLDLARIAARAAFDSVGMEPKRKADANPA